jgi:hypothetical protein
MSALVPLPGDKRTGSGHGRTDASDPERLSDAMNDGISLDSLRAINRDRPDSCTS